MFRTKILLGVLFVVCAASISNAANIIYVDVNGPNDPGTGSYNEPFRKIQDAIDAAIGGDTIEIQPGLYTGQGNYDLDPNGLSITIRSADPNDPNVVAATIIDCNGPETEYHRGFNFHSGEDANCIISGLTIRNGYHGGNGGGIFCDNSSPTIANCVISDNYTLGKGGAIFCYYSSPTIANCIITNGHANGKGGAIYCNYSSPTIANCVISGNYSGIHGGAIFCQDGSPEIIGCLISGNSAEREGGALEFWWPGSEPNILNCVISNNHALNGEGGGVDCFYGVNATLTNCTLVKNSASSGGALYSLGSDVTVKNSIFRANEANDANLGPQVALEPYFEVTSSMSISYSDVQGGAQAVYDPCDALIWGSGNIDAEPYFASFDSDGEPNDFHLQSAYGRWDPNSQSWVSDANTSPCVDAGDPNSDWSGEPWPNGKRINMGAYGGTNQASMNGNPADFDIDGAVNFVDFAEFSNKWLTQESCIEDLSKNGVVDFADLKMFAENWLWQRE